MSGGYVWCVVWRACLRGGVCAVKRVPFAEGSGDCLETSVCVLSIYGEGESGMLQRRRSVGVRYDVEHALNVWCAGRMYVEGGVSE